MRVLWVLSAGMMSGAETSLSGVLPIFRKQGIRPEVAVPRRGPVSRFMAARGCPVHVIPRVPWRRFAVVHTHTHVFEGALAARALGIPHVWRVADHQLRFRKRRGRISPADQVRAMAALSDAVLPCSRSLKEELIRCGVHGSRVLHLGVRMGKLSSLKGRRIVCIANFQPWKGHLHLIHAMREVKDAELVLAGGIGDRNYYERCRRAAKGLPVRFVGYVRDVRPLLHRASVLAVPGVEALSMAALEGMAEGLPVVSVDRGGVLDVVVHGRTGFLVPERQFGQALRRLLDDPGLRRWMGWAGRERARVRFGVDRLARGLARVYRSVSRVRGSSI